MIRSISLGPDIKSQNLYFEIWDCSTGTGTVNSTDTFRLLLESYINSCNPVVHLILYFISGPSEMDSIIWGNNVSSKSRALLYLLFLRIILIRWEFLRQVLKNGSQEQFLASPYRFHSQILAVAHTKGSTAKTVFGCGAY